MLRQPNLNLQTNSFCYFIYDLINPLHLVGAPVHQHYISMESFSTKYLQWHLNGLSVKASTVHTGRTGIWKDQNYAAGILSHFSCSQEAHQEQQIQMWINYVDHTHCRGLLVCNWKYWLWPRWPSSSQRRGRGGVPGWQPQPTCSWVNQAQLCGDIWHIKRWGRRTDQILILHLVKLSGHISELGSRTYGLINIPKYSQLMRTLAEILPGTSLKMCPQN